MKKIHLIFLLIIILCFSGCAPSSATQEFYAMNTVMNITVYNGNQDLIEEAKQTVMELESLLSVTNINSEIYAVNQRTTNTLSSETIDLLKTALALSKETNGLFDITVYPAVKAWGFTQEKNRVPTQEELNTLLPFINFQAISLNNNTLSLPEGAMIDLGAIAKGYATDKVAKQLEEKGCNGAVLSFGGNVKTIGTKPGDSTFQIAVQSPHNPGEILGTLAVQGNTALVTSGDYQRTFESNGNTYHHIIDPRTAKPAESDLTSVTVICSSATKADAFATALYIMGLKEGMNFVENQKDVEAIFVTKTKEVYKSSGISSFVANNKDYTFYPS